MRRSVALAARRRRRPGRWVACRVGPGTCLPRGRCARSHRWCRVGCLMAALLGRALVDVPMFSKPTEHAIMDALDDRDDIRLRRWRRLMQAHAVTHLLEDTVHSQLRIDVRDDVAVTGSQRLREQRAEEHVGRLVADQRGYPGFSSIGLT